MIQIAIYLFCFALTFAPSGTGASGGSSSGSGGSSYSSGGGSYSSGDDSYSSGGGSYSSRGGRYSSGGGSYGSQGNVLFSDYDNSQGENGSSGGGGANVGEVIIGVLLFGLAICLCKCLYDCLHSVRINESNTTTDSNEYKFVGRKKIRKSIESRKRTKMELNQDDVSWLGNGPISTFRFVDRAYSLEEHSFQGKQTTRIRFELDAQEIMFDDGNDFQSLTYRNQLPSYNQCAGSHVASAPVESEFCSLSSEGEDSTGPFRIQGVLHEATGRIVLKMQYLQGGDVEHNIGHVADIRLKPQHDGKSFTGYWYVNTGLFEDIDVMHLL